MFQVSCQGGFEDNCVSGEIFKQRRSEGSADETCRIPSMDPVLADLLNLRFFSSVYHLCTLCIPTMPVFFYEIHPSQHFLVSQRVFCPQLIFILSSKENPPRCPLTFAADGSVHYLGSIKNASSRYRAPSEKLALQFIPTNMNCWRQNLITVVQSRNPKQGLL